MITAIIVDDEPGVLRTLTELICKNLPDIEIAGTAVCVDDAVALIHEKNPRLVFLDIDMPGGDGFTLFDKIKNPDFKVIFTTGYAEFGAMAYKVGAVGYIMKPVKPNDLIEAVGRFRTSDEKHMLNQRLLELEGKIKKLLPHKDTIILFDKKNYCIIDEDDIISLTSDNSYTTFQFINRIPIVTAKNIGYYEEVLSKDRFFRIHRSHLVNIHHAKEYTKSKQEVKMINNKYLPVAKETWEKFKAVIDKK